MAPHDHAENRSGNRAGEKLARDCRSNAKLLEMIIATDLSHDGKKWPWRDKHREAVAYNCERCRHSKKPRQKQHHRRHRNAGNEPSE